jgi:MFS family permease
LPHVIHEQGFFPLLLSTTLAEVAGNMVYVALLERAYELGGEIAGVAGVLLVQSAPQILLGIWAGVMVDRLGKRRAAILATTANAGLAVALITAQTILAVLLLAFLIMLTRLVLFPARFALVSHLSSKANLVTANTALTIVTSIALFLGPAISVALTLLADSLEAPFLVAGLGLLLSALPLLFIPVQVVGPRAVKQANLWQEMRIGCEFIVRHSAVWQVLLCLVNFTLVTGAVTPLITPLAHNFGLDSEGTGVFFTAVGLGGLIGAPLTIALSKRVKPSLILPLSGLLVPVGVLLIGLIDSLEGVLIAVILTALSGASLNVIVLTILQRLTPSSRQGCVFGAEQALLGMAWVVALAATSGGLAIWPEAANTEIVFLLIGGFGLLSVLVSWFWHRRQIQIACELCEPRFQVLGTVCRVICGGHWQCCY